MNEVKTQICQLPAQQFEGIKQRSNDALSSCSDPAPSKKYHYDHTARSCVEVEFSGCFGTDNLFDGEDECLKFCSGPINFEVNQVTIDTNEEEKSQSNSLYIYLQYLPIIFSFSVVNITEKL